MTPLETGTIAGVGILITIFAVFRLRPAVPVVVALGLLVSCAISIALGKDDLAEQIGRYAYYLLIVGVMVTFVEQIRTPRDKVNEWIASFGSLVVKQIESVSNRARYSLRRTVQKWPKRMTVEEIQTKGQMIRGKVVQDELRKRSAGWDGAEEVRKWQERGIQVVDASVIICWFSEQQWTIKALEVREKILDGEVKAVIPDFALDAVTRALRNNPALNEKDIVIAAESVRHMALVVTAPISSLGEVAVKLASQYGVDIYSASCVALASELRAEFITADRGLYERIRQLKFVKFVGEVDEFNNLEN